MLVLRVLGEVFFLLFEDASDLFMSFLKKILKVEIYLVINFSSKILTSSTAFVKISCEKLLNGTCLSLFTRVMNMNSKSNRRSNWEIITAPWSFSYVMYIENRKLFQLKLVT